MEIGTPEYMAPEQWTGKVTAQTDIYALGIIFYELVTGRKPFTADTPAAILLKQATDPLPRPRDFIPELPESAEKALFKALAKDPVQRYECMADFAAVLSSLAALPERPFAGQQQQSPGWAETMVRPTSEKPAPPSQLTPPPQPVPRPQSGWQSPSQTTPPPKMSTTPPGQINPAASRGWLKNPVFWGAAAVMVLIGLAGLAVAVSSLISFANRYTDPGDFTVLQDYAFSAAGDQIENLVPGPDGLIYFNWDYNGKREIYSVDRSGNLIQLTETAGDFESFLPTYAGGDIYYASDQSGKVEIYQHIPGGSPVRITNTPGDGISSQPAAGPDGELYFVSDRSGKFEIYRLNAGGTARLTETLGDGGNWAPSPGPKGSVYFSSDRDGNLEIYRLDADGEVTQLTETPGSIVNGSHQPDPMGWSSSHPIAAGNIASITSIARAVSGNLTDDGSDCWGAKAEGGDAVIFLADQNGVPNASTD